MMEKEALRIENACGRFLKLAVLDHFNFSANSGEICCLFGAHNAGKTVFMQLLAGKLAGEWSMRLLLDGVDVHWSPGNNPVARAGGCFFRNRLAAVELPPKPGQRRSFP